MNDITISKEVLRNKKFMLCCKKRGIWFIECCESYYMFTIELCKNIIKEENNFLIWATLGNIADLFGFKSVLFSHLERYSPLGISPWCEWTVNQKSSCCGQILVCPLAMSLDRHDVSAQRKSVVPAYTSRSLVVYQPTLWFFPRSDWR